MWLPGSVRRQIRSSLRHAPVLLAMAVLVAAVGCGGDDEGDASMATDPPTTVETTATTAPPTTEAPTTTTEAPTTTTTEPPPPPEPVSVLVVGDSVGFTLGENRPDEIPLVTSVESRALPGCGLLTSGPRPADAVAAGAPADYDGCAGPIVDADAAGLATGPDVVLLVLGAWERPDHERDGVVVGPGDEAWTDGIRTQLRDRVASLQAAGPRVGLWVDPCGPDDDTVARQEWFRDEVLAPVADELGAALVDPTEVACADGAPRTDVEGVGDPRPDDGQHWSAEGAQWLWTAWLGPALAEVGRG